MTDGTAPLDRLEHADAQGHADSPGADASASTPHDIDAAHARKKRNKVRAAWIAFVGRILAQLIGAIATIMLGLYVVRTYGVGDAGSRDAAPADAPAVVAPSAPHDHRSIAVLPLVTYTPGASDEALAAGLTEAVIAQLAQDRSLRVVSRTSSMAYRRSDKTLPVIARELGVDLVLEGSITRVGERVRLTAQLVDASTDTHLWAASYDRTTGDLLGLEADLSRRVADAVRAAVQGAPR